MSNGHLTHNRAVTAALLHNKGSDEFIAVCKKEFHERHNIFVNRSLTAKQDKLDSAENMKRLKNGDVYNLIERGLK